MFPGQVQTEIQVRVAVEGSHRRLPTLSGGGAALPRAGHSDDLRSPEGTSQYPALLIMLHIYSTYTTPQDTISPPRPLHRSTVPPFGV